MAQHPNAERLVQLNDAWGRGDIEAANQFWAEDVVWQVPGKSQLAGVYRGRDAMNELVARFFELGGGTLRLEALETLADDHHLLVVFRATAERNGMSLDVEDANAVLVDDDGKFTACWWLPNDQAAFDAFWS